MPMPSANPVGVKERNRVFQRAGKQSGIGAVHDVPGAVLDIHIHVVLACGDAAGLAVALGSFDNVERYLDDPGVLGLAGDS